MFDLINGINRVCMAPDEGADGGSGGGGEAATAVEATAEVDAGGDTGAADTNGDDANKDSASEGSEAKDTGEGEDADKEADNDKTKDDSDDAEKSKADDDGDEAEGTEPLTVDDFEMPEGMEVDEGMMNEFLEIANNTELSGKDRDQAMVSLYAQKQQEALDAQYQSWDDQRIEWKNESKADKEIGGKAFDENMSHAQKAMAHFGTKEYADFGKHYGFVDNPEHLRFLVRVGKTLSEDNSSGNTGGGDNQTPIENRWYGSGDKK